MILAACDELVSKFTRGYPYIPRQGAVKASRIQQSRQIASEGDGKNLGKLIAADRERETVQKRVNEEEPTSKWRKPEKDRKVKKKSKKSK